MYPINIVLSKYWFLRKGLIVFSLKAVNVVRPRPHQEADRSLFPQIVSCKLDKVSCVVLELSSLFEDVDPLVQKLARFLL